MEFLSLDESRNAMKFLWITFCVTPSAEGLAKASISIMLVVSSPPSCVLCDEKLNIRFLAYRTNNVSPIKTDHGFCSA